MNAMPRKNRRKSVGRRNRFCIRIPCSLIDRSSGGLQLSRRSFCCHYVEDQSSLPWPPPPLSSPPLSSLPLPPLPPPSLPPLPLPLPPPESSLLLALLELSSFVFPPPLSSLILLSLELASLPLSSLILVSLPLSSLMLTSLLLASLVFALSSASFAFSTGNGVRVAVSCGAGASTRETVKDASGLTCPSTLTRSPTLKGPSRTTVSSTVTVVPLMTHWSPAMLSTVPTKATRIASIFPLLAASGVAVAGAAPQALRTRAPRIRTKVRNRMFFMICLS